MNNSQHKNGLSSFLQIPSVCVWEQIIIIIIFNYVGDTSPSRIIVATPLPVGKFLYEENVHNV